MTAPGETGILADFLSGLAYDDLPEEVVGVAKLCVLDSLGVALAAAPRPWSRMVVGLVRDSGGAEESTIWGEPWTTTASQAALANGTAVHGIEMDDRRPPAQQHAGATAIPAAFALVEKTGGGGRALLTAVVAGYELGLRVGAAVWARTGLAPAGHKGIWNAVGAAGKALELDPVQMRDAFGLAGSMASGINEYNRDPRGTMVKRLHTGLAAQHGVMAALLAAKGFTGPATVLEGPYGYCRVFSPHDRPPRMEELTRDLGHAFRIVEREVKPYAAWGGSHVAIDAVAALLASGRLHAADVDRVAVHGSTRLLTGHELQRPESLMAAQFSLPFVTAVALCRGPSALMDPDGVWTDEILGDPDVLRLSTRTRLVLDDEMEAMSQRDRDYGGARVTVELRDGSVLEHVALYSKGTLRNPMSPGEVHEKFRRITARVLAPAAAERLVDLVGALDELGDLGPLSALLRGPATLA